MLKPLGAHRALIVIFISLFSIFSSAADVKEWTMLVFLNGHNNLDYFGDMNVKQMEEVGSTDQVNVVVQWASLGYGDTRRIFIKKGGHKVIESMPPVDMGDYRSLIEFVRWAHQNFPAKKYFIDVWNHGSGWHLKNLNISPKDISSDDRTGNVITTEQLGVAMKEISSIIGTPIELYGSDACLMGMAEVASQMSDSVKYFAGSQELEPGEGWPYSTFLTRFTQYPEADGKEVGKMLAEEYLKSYSGGIYGNKEVTFSILDLGKLNQFTSAMRGLASNLNRLNEEGLRSVREAAKASQYFYYDDYRDVKDFLKFMKTKMDTTQLNKSIENVENAVSELVVTNQVSPSYSSSSGVSVWLPTSSYDWNSYGERYMKLNFNIQTNWGSIGEKLTNLTK